MDNEVSAAIAAATSKTTRDANDCGRRHLSPQSQSGCSEALKGGQTVQLAERFDGHPSQRFKAVSGARPTRLVYLIQNLECFCGSPKDLYHRASPYTRRSPRNTGASIRPLIEGLARGPATDTGTMIGLESRQLRTSAGPSRPSVRSPESARPEPYANVPLLSSAQFPTARWLSPIEANVAKTAFPNRSASR